MAIIHQRLYRKGESGYYDLLYLETSSKMVLRPNGTSVEDALSSIKTPTLEALGGVSKEQMKTAIEEALDSVEADLSSAYNVISDMNGTVPTAKNIGNLASSIQSIPQYVPPVALEGITISKLPNKTLYLPGESFNPDGMSVYAVLADGTGLPVPNNSLRYTPSGPLTQGTTTLTVSLTWGEITVSQDITIRVDYIGTAGPSKALRIDNAKGGSQLIPTSSINFVQEGEGTPSLGNIRNINGLSNITLTRYGKNLLDTDKLLDAANWFQGVSTDGVLVTGSNHIFPISVKEGITYTLSISKSGPDERIAYYYLLKVVDGVGSVVKYMYVVNEAAYNYNPVVTFTPAAGEQYYIYANFNCNGPDTELGIELMSGTQLEAGAVATTYESYQNGESVSRSLSEVVYGGNYNWTTGELTITHKMYSLAVIDMVNTSSQKYPGWFVDLSECCQKGSNDLKSLGCNVGTSIRINCTTNKDLIFMPSSVYGMMTAEEWKEHYPDLICQFVVSLLEPRTVQLTAQEFTALAGTNTLISDCGDTTVEYFMSESAVSAATVDAQEVEYSVEEL